MCLPSGLFHKMSYELMSESTWNGSTTPPTFSFSSNGVFLLSFAIGAQLTKLDNTSFHEKVNVEFLDCRMEYAIDKCHRSHVTENWHFYFFFHWFALLVIETSTSSQFLHSCAVLNIYQIYFHPTLTAIDYLQQAIILLLHSKGQLF